jgi:uncharacterized membrane protein YqjE
MADVDPPSFGLFRTFRKIGDTVLAAAQTRLELVSLELQEEKGRLIKLAVWLAAAVFLGVMAMVLVTLTIVFAFGEEARVYVLAGLSLFYIVAALVAFFQIRSRLRKGLLPFADTISELKKDRSLLLPPK